MIVRELILRLNNLPQDLTVVTPVGNGYDVNELNTISNEIALITLEDLHQVIHQSQVYSNDAEEDGYEIQPATKQVVSLGTH